MPAEPWSLARGLGRLRRRLVADVRARPSTARRRWLRRGGAGFLVCLVLVGAGTRLARRYAPVLERWDQSVRGRLTADAWLTVDGALWLGVPGDTLVLVGVVVGAAVIAVDRGRPFRALTLLAALPLVEALVLAGWLSWSRSRPGSLLDGIGGWAFPAFPSGHAAQSAVVYGLLALWWAQASARRSERVTAALAAVAVWTLIAYCRVRVGSHWPSDVLAGGLLGAVWLAVLATALRAVEPGAPNGPARGADQPPGQRGRPARAASNSATMSETVLAPASSSYQAYLRS